MTTTTGTPPSTYQDLVRWYPPRPIRSDENLDAMISRLNSILTQGRGLSPDEEDYCEALGMMIHAYEAERYPLPEMSAVEVIQYMMQENQLTLKLLSEQTGIPVATLGAVASGKRGITPRVREALAKRFCLDPSMFV